MTSHNFCHGCGAGWLHAAVRKWPRAIHRPASSMDASTNQEPPHASHTSCPRGDFRRVQRHWPGHRRNVCRTRRASGAGRAWRRGTATCRRALPCTRRRGAGGAHRRQTGRSGAGAGHQRAQFSGPHRPVVRQCRRGCSGQLPRGAHRSEHGGGAGQPDRAHARCARRHSHLCRTRPWRVRQHDLAGRFCRHALRRRLQRQQVRPARVF